MQVTILKNEGLDFHAKISTPLTEINNEIQEELLNLTKNKKVKLDGFRAGNIPISIIKKRYEQSVRQDVIKRRVDDNINNVIKQHELHVFGNPKIEDLQNDIEKDLEFILKLELSPKITIPDLTKISIEKPVFVVDPKDVDEEIKKLVKMTKEYNKETKEKIKDDDQVTMDTVGYINGEVIKGSKLTDYKLVIGSKALIEGFEEQLIGTKSGDEVEIDVTFPKDYHAKDLAGKPAHFIVQIKAVHTAEPIEINDEFAKKFQANNLEELHSNISKSITKEKEDAISIIMKMHLFDQLEKLLEFNVPQSLLAQESNILKKEAESEHDNTLFEEKSKEEIAEYYEKLALRRVRIGLMLTEYIQNKNLQLELDDLQKVVIRQTRGLLNQGNQGNMIFDFYKKNPKAIEQLKGPAFEAKAVQHIFDYEVKLIEKKYNKAELDKLLADKEHRVMIHS